MRDTVLMRARSTYDITYTTRSKPFHPIQFQHVTKSMFAIEYTFVPNTYLPSLLCLRLLTVTVPHPPPSLPAGPTKPQPPSKPPNIPLYLYTQTKSSSSLLSVINYGGEGGEFRTVGGDQEAEIHIPGDRRTSSSWIHSSHRRFLSHSRSRQSLPSRRIQWRWFVFFFFLPPNLRILLFPFLIMLG